MNEIIDKDILEDKKISIALMSSFAILTIQYLILIYFNLIDTHIGQVVQLTSKGLVGFFYLLALPAILKRNKIKFLGIYFIWIFIFIFNYAFFNENWIYLKSIIFPLFFTGLPSFIYAYSINDWDVLMDVMKKTSNIVFIIGTLIGILVFTGNASIGAYSMSLSYYMLLPAIMYMNNFIDNKTIKNLVFLGTSLVIITALGSRGAIMCFGAFTILKLVKGMKKITLTKALIYILLLGLLILGIVLFNDIIEFLYNTLLKYGINSRTLKLFLGDSIHLSGRDRIYEDVLKATLNKPLLGLGLAGDRHILGGNRGSYAHNIFLEILSHFGIIVGSFFIILLIYKIIKITFKKDMKIYNMAIIWISLALIPLMVSSSYLIDFKFWIMIGLISKSNN